MDLYKKINYGFEMDDTIPYKSIINLQQLVFETTSQCNLKCLYCGYGELYNTKRITAGKNMDFCTAKMIIDYLFQIWKENPPHSSNHTTFFGFYGGEPLINMALVEQIITYIESLPHLPNRNFEYSMTTNALLLNKYMDYIAAKNIKLLISLDGDEYAHSYRVDHNDNNSFDRVIANISLLKERHPDYFETSVSFNSVLTDKSNFFSVKKFIYDKFNKYPRVSELDNSGILNEKRDMFNRINHSLNEDWTDVSDLDGFEQFVLESPNIAQLSKLIKYLSGNSFATFNSLLSDQFSATFPTGTCLPFDRKMFITVDGFILPCERIHSKYTLGEVTRHGVLIDFKKIALKYSFYYKKMWSQCASCYTKPICETCMFYVEDLDTKPRCPFYRSKQNYDNLLATLFAFLSKKPHLYAHIVDNIY